MDRYTRRGILEGQADIDRTSAPVLRSNLEADDPNPPTTTDFTYSGMTGNLPLTLGLSVNGGATVDVVFATNDVTSIKSDIETAAPSVSVEFNNNFITLVGPANGSLAVVAPTAGTDASSYLGLALEPVEAHSTEAGDTYPSPSRPGEGTWSRQKLLSDFEDRTTRSINRAISSALENSEALYYALQKEITVPEFFNSDMAGKLQLVTDGSGDVIGIRFLDTVGVAVSGDASQTARKIEEQFRVTDLNGGETLSQDATGDYIRVTMVTTGTPVGVIPSFDTLDTKPVGGTVAASTRNGDGGALIESMGNIDGATLSPHILTAGLADTGLDIIEIVDNVAIKFDMTSGDVPTFPDIDSTNIPVGSYVNITGSTGTPTDNNGWYIVEEHWATDTIKIRPVDGGRHSLSSTGSLGRADFHMAKAGTGVEDIYVMFDDAYPVENFTSRGYGIWFGKCVPLYQAVVDHFSSWGVQAAPAIAREVYKQILAIKGPNSLDPYTEDVGVSNDSNVSRGDLINLESLSQRPLEGRTKFDLNGNDLAQLDSITKEATFEELQSPRATLPARIGNAPPVLLYGSGDPHVPVESQGTKSSVTSGVQRFEQRPLGGGPYSATLYPAGVLEVQGGGAERFYPSDVGFYADISGHPDGLVNSTYLITGYISPTQVIVLNLENPDMRFSSSVVTYTVLSSQSYTPWGGALLRLDKGTSSAAETNPSTGFSISPSSQTEDAHLAQHIIPASTDKITGLMISTGLRTRTGGSTKVIDYFDKEAITAQGGAWFTLDNLNVMDNPWSVQLLGSRNGFSDATVDKAVYTAKIADIDNFPAYSFNDTGATIDLAFPGICLGTTVVEISGSPASDGLYFIDFMTCDFNGLLQVKLKTLGSNDAPGSVTDTGFIRFYTPNMVQNFTYPSSHPTRDWLLESDRAAFTIRAAGETDSLFHDQAVALRLDATSQASTGLEILMSGAKSPDPNPTGGSDSNFAGFPNNPVGEYGIRIKVQSPNNAGIAIDSKTWQYEDRATQQQALPDVDVLQGEGGYGIFLYGEHESRAISRKMFDDGTAFASDIFSRSAPMGIYNYMPWWENLDSQAAHSRYRDPALVIKHDRNRHGSAPTRQTRTDVSPPNDTEACIVVSASDEAGQRRKENVSYSIRFEDPSSEPPVNYLVLVAKPGLFPDDVTVSIELQDDPPNAGDFVVSGGAGWSGGVLDQQLVLKYDSGAGLLASTVEANIIAEADAGATFLNTYFDIVSANTGSFNIDPTAIRNLSDNPASTYTVNAQRWANSYTDNNCLISAQSGGVDIIDGTLSITSSSKGFLSGVTSDLNPTSCPYFDSPISVEYTGEFASAVTSPQTLGEAYVLSTSGATVVNYGDTSTTAHTLDNKDVGRYLRFYFTYTTASGAATGKIVRRITDTDGSFDTPIGTLDLNPVGNTDGPLAARTCTVDLLGHNWDANLHDVNISGDLTMLAKDDSGTGKGTITAGTVSADLLSGTELSVAGRTDLFGLVQTGADVQVGGDLYAQSNRLVMNVNDSNPLDVFEEGQLPKAWGSINRAIGGSVSINTVSPAFGAPMSVVETTDTAGNMVFRVLNFNAPDADHAIFVRGHDTSFVDVTATTLPTSRVEGIGQGSVATGFLVYPVVIDASGNVTLVNTATFDASGVGGFTQFKLSWAIFSEAT